MDSFETQYKHEYEIDDENDVMIDPFLINNCIILTEDDLEDMLRHIRTKKASLSLKAKGIKQ